LNSLGKRLWQRWVEIAKKIGDFQARLLLTLFYLVLVLPLGMIVRLFLDPLSLKKTSPEWTSRPNTAAKLEDARKQF
jgi:hypothetical protein